MQNREFRDKEFIRTLLWIEENCPLWETICGHGKEDMTMRGFQCIMGILEKESLYTIMMVFMTVYKDVRYVNQGLEKMFINMLKREWENNKGIKMVEILIRNLD